MQATQPPAGAWLTWQERQGSWDRSQRRRVRLSLAELAALRDLHNLNVDWTRIRPEITLYTPNQIRQLIRFGALTRSDGRQSLVFPTMPARWFNNLPVPKDPAVPWRLPDVTHIQLEPRPAAAGPAPRAGAGGGGGGGGAWEGAARALPVGALLLALLVLLVRVAEKCLDKDFFTLRRCQSEEWPTPNVLATSMRVNDTDLGPRVEDSAFPGPLSAADPPPPYSSCTPKPPPSSHEEPPPPYSACYVTYNNPKDGVPSVHFYNRDRQELYTEGHTSCDGGQALSSGETIVDCNANGTELRFDNGRVVERVVNANDESSTNVEVARVTLSSSPRDRYLIV